MNFKNSAKKFLVYALILSGLVSSYTSKSKASECTPLAFEKRIERVMNDGETPEGEVVPEIPVLDDPLITEETSIPSIMSIAPPTNPTNTLSYDAPTADNILGNASEWNGFVLGDITDCIDFEGSIAVAGSINSDRGLSVNGGANGGSPADTEDITLLVGGNLNLNCNGTVWGQTAVGTSNGNTYGLSNVTTGSTTSNGTYMIVDSVQYFSDAATALKGANSTIANKTQNSNYTNNGYGSFDFEGNPNETELVYVVDENDFTGFVLNFNLNDNQTAVVNLTSDQAISLLNGSFSINGNNDSNYLRQNANKITFNVVNSGALNMTSCELYGTLLAPNTDLIGNNASVCGVAIVNNLEAQGGFEFHVGMGLDVPMKTPTPPVTTPPIKTPTPPVTTPPMKTPTPPVTTPPIKTPTPPVTTPPMKTPTPTPSENEIPEVAPKTGDESITGIIMSSSFLGLAFASGIYFDKREEELDETSVIKLRRKRK